MQALISPNEKVFDENGSYLGQRVAQVEPDNAIFEVSPPLFWFPCKDNVVADQWYFSNNAFFEISKTNTIDVTPTVVE